MSVGEDPRVPRPYLIGFDSECNDFKGDKLHYGKPDVHRATFIWTGAGVATYQRRHHHDQTTDVTGAPVRLPHPPTRSPMPAHPMHALATNSHPATPVIVQVQMSTCMPQHRVGALYIDTRAIPPPVCRPPATLCLSLAPSRPLTVLLLWPLCKY